MRAEDTAVRVLWTFESQPKLDLFAAILQEAGITCETAAMGKNKNSGNEVTVSVDEREYEQAKKILMKYRKRRTTT